MVTPSSHAEVERKYEVAPELLLPPLHEVPGVAKVAQPEQFDLEAVYFDTDDLRLAAAGITLRRRSGGADAGWHLKLPVGADEREELRLPLDGPDAGVPEPLLDRVRAEVRDAPLVPVASVRTHRTTHRLLSADGTTLVEVTDDEVAAERLADGHATQRWREWEVELVGGERELVDVVETVVLEAGARAADIRSKLARVLGDRLPRPATPPTPVTPKRAKKASTGDTLLVYVRAHLAELHREDTRFRAGEDSAVHKMRIAARRLRSALASYRPLVETGSTDDLRADLKWLGVVLAEARDAQVLRQRLSGLLATQPVELVLGPVAERIDDELRQTYLSGRADAAEALGSEQYFRLLDRLDAFVADPPFTAEAAEPARERLPRLLKAETRRVRKRARRVRRATEPAQRDLALHDVRKASKRLRYAAESARPALGKPAKRLASRAKAAQQLLGEHQDTVVARRTLRDIGVRAHLAGENGFTFGRLHALEEARAEALEQRYPAVAGRLLEK